MFKKETARATVARAGFVAEIATTLPTAHPHLLINPAPYTEVLVSVRGLTASALVNNPFLTDRPTPLEGSPE